jgi:hypothetical protein
MAVRRTRRGLSRAAAAAPERQARIAAAERVLKELLIQYENHAIEGAAPGMAVVSAYNHSFACLTNPGGKDTFITVKVNQGERLKWNGFARVGARGNILFGFVPDDGSYLHSRAENFSKAELPHTELEKAFGAHSPGSFAVAITNMMGAPIEDLITQALSGVDESDLKGAEVVENTPEPIVFEDPKDLEEFGAWS